MKTTIKLAVASALVAAATSANAGIVIPAGDWTLDINGNVNAYATWTNSDRAKGTVSGAIASTPDAAGEKNTQGINTGLLPAWLGFSGKTRQNDLDVAFTISFQPNVSDNSGAGDNKTPLNRQAFITFGDKSWGSIKLGKDIGIFAQDAILNDMTLLGVGGGAGNSGTSTTLGGIGTGYIYAAWKGQVTYTSPNWNGFSFAAGITNPNQGFGSATVGTGTTAVTSNLNQDRFGFEGKVQYEWAGDVSGKVWASGASYDVTAQTSTAAAVLTTDSYKANAWDIGANVNVAGFGLTGYYYDGKGAGTTIFGDLGAQINTVTGQAKRRDSNGGYLQGTYTIPGVGTKIGLAYGISKLDNVAGDPGTLVESNRRYTVGAYHPLTKHLNLVAEYNNIKSEGQASANEYQSDSISAGAILFF